MGLVDLDRLLAGGLPLASVLLLLEDPCSGQHINLMRYFMAEGVACRQRVLWLTASPPPGGPGAFLPAEASSSQSSSAADAAAQDKEQPELLIAWQYKKYIKDEPAAAPASRTAASSSSSTSSSAATGSARSGSSFARAGAAVAAGVGREWCHSYDLTRPLGEEALRGAPLEVAECSGQGAYGAADQQAAAFLSSLQSAADAGAGAAPGSAAAVLAAASAARKPEGVGRLVIESAGSLAWGGGGGSASDQEQALLRLLYNVRQRAQQARCAVMVTVPAGLLSPGVCARLPHLADTVLALDPLADDSQLHRLLPDPASAVALLSVRKLCAAGMLGPRTTDGVLHVVRNKRRRLGLSPVEVDPDAEDRLAEAAAKAAAAYASGGGGNGGGGGGGGAGGKAAKGAASMLCGGPPAPGGGSKALDF